MLIRAREIEEASEEQNLRAAPEVERERPPRFEVQSAGQIVIRVPVRELDENVGHVRLPDPYRSPGARRNSAASQSSELRLLLDAIHPGAVVGARVVGRDLKHLPERR